MEPGAPHIRRSHMRPFALILPAICLPLVLGGCSSDRDDVATDPATTVTSTTPRTAPTATASATVGSYPEFAPTDYTYLLTVQCFCASTGTPMEVTVVDGKVVSASGQPFQVTIADIIAAANDTSADKVTVDWPLGQDYPDSVYVDRSKNIADDEIGYAIADVQVG